MKTCECRSFRNFSAFFCWQGLRFLCFQHFPHFSAVCASASHLGGYRKMQKISKLSWKIRGNILIIIKSGKFLNWSNLLKILSLSSPTHLFFFGGGGELKRFQDLKFIFLIRIPVNFPATNCKQLMNFCNEIEKHHLNSFEIPASGSISTSVWPLPVFVKILRIYLFTWPNMTNLVKYIFIYIYICLPLIQNTQINFQEPVFLGLWRFQNVQMKLKLGIEIFIENNSFITCDSSGQHWTIDRIFKVNKMYLKI